MRQYFPKIKVFSFLMLILFLYTNFACHFEPMRFANENGISSSSSLSETSQSQKSETLPPMPLSEDGVTYPKTYLNKPTLNLSANRKIYNVGTGLELQQALDQSQPGDEIILQNGSDYLIQSPMENFVLRKKPASDKWIYIHAQNPPSQSLEGFSPTGLPRLISKGLTSTLIAENGAHHYWILGLEITVDKDSLPTVGDNVENHQGIIRLGFGDESQLNDMPSNIGLERCWIHGFPAKGVKRGVSLNGNSLQIVESRITEIHAGGQESQGVAGWNGVGPLRISNNFIQTAGIQILFGGADHGYNVELPSDIEISNNTFRKDMTWKKGSTEFAGNDYVVKNQIELKFAKRVLIYGNDLKQNWIEDQDGYSLRFRTDSVLEDIVLLNNSITETSNGLFVGGGNANATPVSRVLLKENQFDTTSYSVLGGDGITLLVQDTHGFVVKKNRFLSGGTFLYFTGLKSSGLVITDNLIDPRGGYGVKGDGAGFGAAGLNTYAPGWIFERNNILGMKEMFP